MVCDITVMPISAVALTEFVWCFDSVLWEIITIPSFNVHALGVKLKKNVAGNYKVFIISCPYIRIGYMYLLVAV